MKKQYIILTAGSVIGVSTLLYALAKNKKETSEETSEETNKDQQRKQPKTFCQKNTEWECLPVGLSMPQYFAFKKSNGHNLVFRQRKYKNTKQPQRGFTDIQYYVGKDKGKFRYRIAEVSHVTFTYLKPKNIFHKHKVKIEIKGKHYKTVEV